MSTWMDGWMVGREPDREGGDKQALWAWGAVRFSPADRKGIDELAFGDCMKKGRQFKVQSCKEGTNAPWGTLPARCFAFVTSFHPPWEVSIIAITQMRKMELREIKELARGHTAGQRKHLDSNAGLCDFQVTSDLLRKDFPWPEVNHPLLCSPHHAKTWVLHLLEEGDA